MKLDEIKAIAKNHDIKTAKIKKSDLVRAMQQPEGKETCFGNGAAAQCGQNACLWREDCV